MRILKDVFASVSGAWDAELNFRAIEENLFKWSPDSTTIAGPPTTGPSRGGDWLLDEIWIDALGSLWVNTTPGQPGTWKQLVPAVLTANPVLTVPIGYEILRSDQNRTRKVWNGTQWTRSGRVKFEQVAPSDTWGPFTHSLGYLPSPTVIIGGRISGVNVVLTETTATVTLVSAQSGILFLD